MSMWKLSDEDSEKLMAESRAKDEELKIIMGKSWSDLWEEDLLAFEAALEKQASGERAIERDKRIQCVFLGEQREVRL